MSIIGPLPDLDKINEGSVEFDNKLREKGKKSLDNPEKVVINMADRTPSVPGKGKSLRYPEDIKDEKTDYVLFQFGKYTPPFQGGQAGNNNSSRNKYDSYSRSETLNTKGVDKILPPIILYMPQDISSDTKANWNGKAFSNLGRAALKATSGNLNDLGKDFSVSQAFENAIDALKTGTLNVIPGVGGNLNLNDITASTRGVIINPNVEIIFDSPELREFTLKFKLTPHGAKEAEVISGIFKTFKRAMLPTFNATAAYEGEGGKNIAGGNTIGVPYMCRVNFMMGSDLHPYLPQYKTCAITGVSANFTPDGAYATYEDGSPVATELTVSFLETKLIFAEEINNGFGASF